MEENQVPTPEEAVAPPPEAMDITDDDKLWSLLSWITGIIALIVLFMDDKKSRPFIKYNAVMALTVWIVLGVLVSIISAITCGIGAILAIAFVYPIYLGIKAYQGEWMTVPLLTDFVKNQGWAWAP